MRRVVVIGAVAVVGGLLSFGVATVAEEYDPLCGACHTVPESVYLERAEAAVQAGGAQPDLASAHYALQRAEGAEMQCIACHRGDAGLAARARALALGLEDAGIWWAGQENPYYEKGQVHTPELVDAACVRCHTATLLVTGFGNHYHNKLPAAYALWQAGALLRMPDDEAPRGVPADASDACVGESATALSVCATTVTCSVCHQAHISDVPPDEQYLKQDAVVAPACVRCHVEVGHGPGR